MGDANDATGHGHDGAPVGGITATEDRFGEPSGAYAFDGVDDYIEIPHSEEFITPAVTVAVWARHDSFTSTKAGGCVGQYIFFKRNTLTANFEGYKISFDGPPLTANAMVASSSGLQVGAGSGETIAMESSIWYHLVLTADATSLAQFVDGQLVQRSTTGFPVDVGTRPLFIGRSGEWFDGFLHGAVDDLKVYGRILREDEVRALYERDIDGDGWLMG
jgi:hypothetical protein